MLPLTRAQMRDSIRRRLGLTPSIDYYPPNSGQGQVGDPLTTQPHPSNALINQFIDEEVANLNLQAGLGSLTQPLQVAVAGETTNGPVAVDLSSNLGSPGGGSGGNYAINELKNVWWNDGTANYLMVPRSVDELDRAARDYQDMLPGIPREFWTESYQVWLLPAPAAPGTLFMRADVGLMAPLHDNDTLHQISADLYPKFLDAVTGTICAVNVDDLVYAERGKVFIPRGIAAAADVRMWLARFNKPQQRTLIYGSNRRYSYPPVSTRR